MMTNASASVGIGIEREGAAPYVREAAPHVRGAVPYRSDSRSRVDVVAR